MRTSLFYVLAFVPLFFYLIFSYSQTDPNLVLSSNPIYWNFQQQLWQLGYHQRELSTVLYSNLMLLLSLACFAIMFRGKEEQKISFVITAAILLLFSYPALSHDIFNYMFNAKMLQVYHLDPHVHLALEISSDPWIRFMHNTHTPAPYGHGWTYFSVIPFILGFGKFTTTLGAFKIFMILGLAMLWILQHQLVKFCNDDIKRNFNKLKWLFFLHPLILLETIGNVHNDVWMMVFVFSSYVCIFNFTAAKKSSLKVFWLVIAALAWFMSYEIKFASVALLPLLFLLIGKKIFPYKDKLASILSYWPEISAILLFIPLLTIRSQRFHPWYLFWSMSFIPFIRLKALRNFILAFSISSLFRYAPFLLKGDYFGNVMNEELIITWGAGLVLFVIFLLFQRSSRATMDE